MLLLGENARALGEMFSIVKPKGMKIYNRFNQKVTGENNEKIM
jgi:hypothetical protein